MQGNFQMLPRPTADPAVAMTKTHRLLQGLRMRNPLFRKIAVGFLFDDF
jgi:hypothetical protein